MHRLGLLVGVNRLDDPRLQGLTNAVPDALAVDELLTNLGYETTALYDNAPQAASTPTLANVVAAIDKLCAVANSNTLPLAYFACHGVLANGQMYLVMADTRRDDYAHTGLPLALLVQKLKSCAAQRAVLLIDACHSGITEGREVDIEPASPAEFFSTLQENTRGFAVLSACSSLQIAHEVAMGAHGLFTHFLLHGLRGDADGCSANGNGKGYVTLTDLAVYVHTNVRKQSLEQDDQAVQEPTADIQMMGDLKLTDGPVETRWKPSAKSEIQPGLSPPDAYPARRWFEWEKYLTVPGEAYQAEHLADLPVAVYTAGDLLHLFWKDAKGRLFEIIRSPEEGMDTRELDGNVLLKTAPAVFSDWAGESLYLFALGIDEKMYHRLWTGGQWRPWKEIDTGFKELRAEPLAGTFLDEESIGLWAIAQSGKVKFKIVNANLHLGAGTDTDTGANHEQNRNTVTALKQLGSNLYTAIGENARNPQRLKNHVERGTQRVLKGLFREGANKLVDMVGAIEFDGTPDSGSARNIPVKKGPLTLIAHGERQCRMFCLAADGAIYSRPFQGNSSGSLEGGVWTEHGKGFSGPPLVMSRGPNHIDLFARSDKGQLCQQTFYQGAGWSAWFFHPSDFPLPSAFSGVAASSRSIELFAISHGVIWQKRWRR